MARALTAALLLCAIPAIPFAQQEGAPAERFVVTTKVSPPFAFRGASGDWTGISIELWERITEELDLPRPSYREANLDEMFEALGAGEAGAAVAAISVTPERVNRVDFTHPYYFTGLGIAVSARDGRGLVSTILARLFTWQAVSILGVAVLWLSLIGVLFWLFERRSNPLYKGAGLRKGIGLGFWWAATVLLGNKGVLPTSPASRLLALGGMISSIVLLVSFAGAVVSYLTVSQLDRNIRQPEDLRHLRVATVPGTTSEEYLQRTHILYKLFDDVHAAMDAVAEDRADALVYDAAVLKYLVTTEYTNRARVLSLVFQRQEYAIALPLGSGLRKPINETLLTIRDESWWQNLLYRYLGE